MRPGDAVGADSRDTVWAEHSPAPAPAVPGVVGKCMTGAAWEAGVSCAAVPPGCCSGAGALGPHNTGGCPSPGENWLCRGAQASCACLEAVCVCPQEGNISPGLQRQQAPLPASLRPSAGPLLHLLLLSQVLTYRLPLMFYRPC